MVNHFGKQIINPYFQNKSVGREHDSPVERKRALRADLLKDFIFETHYLPSPSHPPLSMDLPCFIGPKMQIRVI